jgi:hypothetical protein
MTTTERVRVWLEEHCIHIVARGARDRVAAALVPLIEAIEREAFDAGFRRGTQEGARGVPAATSLKCIKSLYKSTYRRNAFTKGKRYTQVTMDEHGRSILGAGMGVWIKDETGHAFNFTREPNATGCYVLSDYFLVPEQALPEKVAVPSL